MLKRNVQKSQGIPILKPYIPGLKFFFVVWPKTLSALAFSLGDKSASHVANAN